MSSPPASEGPLAARERAVDRAHGLMIVSLAFIASIGISLWAKRVSEPELSEPPAPPTTRGVVGWPTRVDPLKTLPAARKLTPRTMLQGFVVEGVARDGTVDIREPGSGVRYVFQSAPGQGPQPPREPGEVPRRNLCGRQAVHIGENGMAADPDQPHAICPPTPLPLPEPACSLDRIWQKALERRVPRRRSARIEYYRSRIGPAWRFEVQGVTRFSVYGGDCTRELNDTEALGSVP